MSYHKDAECNAAMIRLLDALCTWERHTGRRSLLIFIPHEKDERRIIAIDGKPVAEDRTTEDFMYFVLSDEF